MYYTYTYTYIFNTPHLAEPRQRPTPCVAMRHPVCVCVRALLGVNCWGVQTVRVWDRKTGKLLHAISVSGGGVEWSGAGRGGVGFHHTAPRGTTPN